MASTPKEDFVELEGLKVVLRRGESTDRLIRRFMRRVRDDGVLREFMQRKHYEKPSTKKRRKRRSAARIVD